MLNALYNNFLLRPNS